MHVTPLPIARLVSFHHRMPGFVEVFCGVAPGTGVTTGNVSAGQADAQLHRTLAECGTFFAALAAGPDLEVSFVEVFALRHTSLPGNKVG
jgi:hypothetical protein